MDSPRADRLFQHTMTLLATEVSQESGTTLVSAPSSKQAILVPLCTSWSVTEKDKGRWVFVFALEAKRYTSTLPKCLHIWATTNGCNNHSLTRGLLLENRSTPRFKWPWTWMALRDRKSTEYFYWDNKITDVPTFVCLRSWNHSYHFCITEPPCYPKIISNNEFYGFRSGAGLLLQSDRRVVWLCGCCLTGCEPQTLGSSLKPLVTMLCRVPVCFFLISNFTWMVSAQTSPQQTLAHPNRQSLWNAQESEPQVSLHNHSKSHSKLILSEPTERELILFVRLPLSFPLCLLVSHTNHMQSHTQADLLSINSHCRFFHLTYPYLLFIQQQNFYIIK